jgi:hypothetical protein
VRVDDFLDVAQFAEQVARGAADLTKLCLHWRRQAGKKRGAGLHGFASAPFCRCR